MHFQKSEFFDASVLQQNSFDKVDAGPSVNRTSDLMKLSISIIKHNFHFKNKEHARIEINKIIQFLINFIIYVPKNNSN